MNDRFKFRIALHQDKYEEYGLEKFKNQRIFEVKTLNVGYENSTVEIIADYPNGDWAVCEIDEADVDLIQCTGLKDKNGTLIYEGDVIKIKDEIFFIKYEIGSFLIIRTQQSLDVWYEMFIEAWNDDVYPLSQLYVDEYIQEEHIECIEVIGNIYENPELIKELNNDNR